VYASTTRALACLETVVHLGSGSLPLNRYLVEIIVPDAAWENRATFDAALHVGWDAEPAGLVSLNWGTAWAAEGSTLLVELPSVVVPEESNILINPRHRGAMSLRARKVRRWAYDARLR
jgi:RES domain-containing protein